MTKSTVSELQESYCGTEVAQGYVSVRFSSELMALLHERQVTAVNTVIRQQSPERVLEIAPGPGRVTRDVQGARELVCWEFNEGMVEEGRRVCGNRARWIQGDAFHLPFENEFDFVYSYRFIRHFHREDRERLYALIRKALRPQGWFVMDAVNEQVSGPLRAAHPEDYPIYDKLYPNESALRAELRDAGFEVQHIEPVQRWLNLQFRAQCLLGPRSRTLCRWAIRTLEQLRRGPALEWIVTCRRA